MAFLATLAGGVALGRLFAGTSAAQSVDDVIVSSLLPPDGEYFSERESFGALSPDGRQFAFVSLSSRGDRQIWIRQLDELSAGPLPGTTGAAAPFWSPDGRSLGYFQDGQLMRLDLDGTPRRLCASTQGRSGSWGENDLIVISTDRGIERASAVDGGCEVVIAVDAEGGAFAFYHPSLLPGGEAVLFERRGQLIRDVVVGNLESGVFSVLLEGVSGPTFVPPGYVVYGRFAREGTSALFGQKLNAERSGVEGPSIPLSGPVRTSGLVFAYSASTTGSLVYLPGFGDREKLVVDRRGEVVDTLRQQGTWTHAFATAHPWVAMGGANQLWLYDLERGVRADWRRAAVEMRRTLWRIPSGHPPTPQWPLESVVLESCAPQISE